jgi:hypothetical protein
MEERCGTESVYMGEAGGMQEGDGEYIDLPEEAFSGVGGIRESIVPYVWTESGSTGWRAYIEKLGDITPDGVYSQLRCDAPFCNAVDSATLHPKQTVSLGGGGTHTTISRIQALVSWFKHGYMKWIDPIPCPQCSGPTDGEGSTAPTASELAGGGNRVELHRCRDPACGGSRRFVRYTKVSKLLRTREGRCGEFAHLFYAIIRVLIHLKVKGWEQVEARYVWNKEDHVWVEVWSVEERRWVHVDPW